MRPSWWQWITRRCPQWRRSGRRGRRLRPWCGTMRRAISLLSPSSAIAPRAAIAGIDPADERLTLITATRAPHRIRSQLATAFGLPENRLRVIARDVGGGFGMKDSLFPEEVLVLWAARRTGRAVKWTAERSESLVADAHGRDMITTGEMGFDSAGRIVALRATVQSNLGAFLTNAGAVPSLLAASFMSNVYAIPAVHVTIDGVFTNTAFTAPYRGAGVPEAAHLVESLIEQAARELAADPLDLRRRNFIGPQAMPYRTPLLHTYDSGEFGKVLEQTLTLADWDGFAARKAESERNGRLRGRAVAAFIEPAAIGNERMEIRFDPSGTVTIVAGTFSHGQGHETVFAQLVSAWLGVPFESIRLIQGDTDAVSFGRGTFASRSATLRPGAQPPVARGTDPRCGGARHRPGAAGARGVRPGHRTEPLRLPDGLRDAARRRPAAIRGRSPRRAVKVQPARRQGRRRSRMRRRAAGNHQRDSRRAAALRRQMDRDAGGAVSGVARDPRRARRRRHHGGLRIRSWVTRRGSIHIPNKRRAPYGGRRDRAPVRTAA